MGLIKNIIAIIVCVAVFLVVCHFLRIGPWCLVTDAVVAFVVGFDTSNIIPKGPIELGTLSGISTAAGGAAYLYKKTSNKFNDFKQTATKQINSLSTTKDAISTELLAKEDELNKKTELVESQTTQITEALDAKKVAEDQFESQKNEIKRLRNQLDTFNDITAKKNVIAENLDKLPTKIVVK